VNNIQTPYSYQPSYWNVDASLTLGAAPAWGNWSLTAYAKNLTGEVVKDADFVGYLMLGAPRTFGITLTAKTGG
jgi:iron complex outermembrane receptor protein